jgi:hypothetical protein
VHRCMGSHRPAKGRIARARGRTWALATGPLPLPDQMGTKKIHEKKGGVFPPPGRKPQGKGPQQVACALH